MKIFELLIPELLHEVALTEKFLKRLPQERMDWRPHEKSMSIKQLANHLVEIPGWITATMEMDEMEMEGYRSPEFEASSEMIEELKNNTSKAEKALQKPDEEFMKNWKMLMGGETVMDMPKLDVLRTMVLNQLPHHRAQMGVYFRLLEIPVPATYGPSADEGMG